MAGVCRTTTRSCPILKHFANSFLRPVLIRGSSSNNQDSTVEDFDEMFRNSQFVKLGRPGGKKVVGKVTHVVAREKSKDIYLDFGWKFHAVETVPINREVDAGDTVEVMIKSLESTGHFLGQSKRITLNEAEAKFKTMKELK